MKKSIVHPQEIIVWNIIPFLRKEIAFEMKRQDIDQKEIAHLLEVTEAAISQYLNDKRAQHKLKIDKDLKMEISVSAKKIIDKQSKSLFEIQRLLNTSQIKSSICHLHKSEYGAPKNCKCCYLEEQ